MDYGILPWVLFNLFLIVMLALDLFVFNRKAHVIEFKEALKWVVFWVGLAVAFGFFIHFWRGSEVTTAYFSAYMVELSLSVDNLFVFLLLFTYFCVPQEYRHRVLFWGILGAIIMRALFIMAGITLLENIHWIIYIFGAFLVFTGIKMASRKEGEQHPESNPVIKLVSRYLPTTDCYRGSKFFVKEKGRFLATPLFMVLIAIETTDIIFAVDSIPAVLSITTDSFIVYTSNMLAIMGLRSMYFALCGFANKIYYLNYGLAAVLVFLGLKMLLSGILEIPTFVSLAIIAFILGVSIVASLRRRTPSQCGKN